MTLKNSNQLNLLLIFMMVAIWFSCLSCAPMKRHDRIVKKYPFVHTIDSVIVSDTVKITIPEVHFDTIVQIDQLHDTVEFIKDHYHTKLWKIAGDDKIYVDGGCDPIIVEKVITKKVPVTVYKSQKSDFLRNAFILFVIVFILLSILNHYRKQKNECNLPDNSAG